MTLEELQSKTDRELDALIAEKVYGWVWMKLKPGYLQTLVPPGTTGEPCPAPTGDDYQTYAWFALRFSTDLNLAAQVEEKVIEKAGRWALADALIRVAREDGFLYRATARERVIACLMAWQGAMDLAQALNDTLTQYDDALRNLGEGPQGDAE